VKLHVKRGYPSKLCDNEEVSVVSMTVLLYAGETGAGKSIIIDAVHLTAGGPGSQNLFDTEQKQIGKSTYKMKLISIQ
jgi:predicted GTPase